MSRRRMLLANSDPNGEPKILDTYPSTLAVSLMYLSSSYSGAVVRVVERGTDTEQDFTPTELLDGTLAAFIGANDAQITKWYDQSGANNDLSQTSSTQQPYIAISGVINVDGSGQVFLNQSGSQNDSLKKSFTFNGDGSIFCVYNSNDSGNGMLCNNDSSSNYLGAMQSGSNFTPTGGSSGTPTYRANGSNIASSRGALHASYVVNSDVLISVIDANFNSWSSMMVFTYTSTSFTAAAKYKEFIMFSDSNNATAVTDKAMIESNRNSRYTIY